MAPQDTFDMLHEQLQEDSAKQKLSALQEEIKTHISSQGMGTEKIDQIGDALVNGEKIDNFKLDIDVLTVSASMIYAKRLSKDIILRYLSGDTPWKNQSLSWRDSLKDKFVDKMVSLFSKQKDAYDAILAKIEAPVVQKFQAQLDALKQEVGVLPDPNAPQGSTDNAPETMQPNKIPTWLPIAGMKKEDISSDLWHRDAPKKGATEDHKWIDIKVDENTPVLATADGEVIEVGDQPDGAGKYISINHGDYITRYFHLNTQEVKVGDKVKKDKVIAKSGATGNVTWPHLHYEIRNTKKIAYQDKQTASKYEVLDPEKYLDFDGDGKVVALNSDEVEETTIAA